MIQLSLKRFIYGLLYNFPRAFLDIVDSIFFIITVGYYSPGIANMKCMKHSRWASNIARKITNLQYKN